MDSYSPRVGSVGNVSELHPSAFIIRFKTLLASTSAEFRRKYSGSSSAYEEAVSGQHTTFEVLDGTSMGMVLYRIMAEWHSIPCGYGCNRDTCYVKVLNTLHSSICDDLVGREHFYSLPVAERDVIMRAATRLWLELNGKLCQIPPLVEH